MNPNQRVVATQPPTSSFSNPEEVQLYEPGRDAATQPPFPTGTRFAGYVIERLLVRGPVGNAYLAREGDAGPRVVLKVINRDTSENHRFAARFQRDISTLAQVRSPHVPVIRKSGLEDGKLFLAFEHFEGANYAGRGTLPIEEVLRFARDCATGLNALHQAGLVHRDLRPQTILQAGDGRLVLIEFGILRTSMDDEVQLKASLPAFLSSEQAEDVLDIDIRSDLHALGTILFLLLTGTLPFNAPNAEKTKALILANDRPSVRLFRREIHPALDQIVARCMARNRDLRYQTPDELILALDACPHTRPMEGFTRSLILAQEWLSEHASLVKKVVLGVALIIAVPMAWNAYSRYELRSELSALDDPSCTAEAADRLVPSLERYASQTKGEPPEVERWRKAVTAAHVRADAAKAAAAKAKEDEAKRQAELARQAAAEEQRKRDELARIEAAKKAEAEAAAAAERQRLAQEQAKAQRDRLDQMRIVALQARIPALLTIQEPLLGHPTRRSIIALEDALQGVLDLDVLRTALAPDKAFDMLANPTWERLETHRRNLERDLLTARKKQEAWEKLGAAGSADLATERKEDNALRQRLADQRKLDNARWVIK